MSLSTDRPAQGSCLHGWNFPRLHGLYSQDAKTTLPKEDVMNWDQIQGRWKEMTGRIRERWGELTEDEVQQAAGDREQLEGLIQQRYGKSKEQAREELDKWMAEQR